MAKMKVMDIELSDWNIIEPSTPSNYFRFLGFKSLCRWKGCVGWVVSWKGAYCSYVPAFLGDLYFLSPLYYSLYPKPPAGNHYSQRELIVFDIYQIQEAQEHMDKFLMKINNLKSFV